MSEEPVDRPASADDAPLPTRRELRERAKREKSGRSEPEVTASSSTPGATASEDPAANVAASVAAADAPAETSSPASRAPEPSADDTPAEPYARHGRLPRRRATKGIFSLVASAMAVLLVASASVGTIWVWSLANNVSATAIEINEEDAVPPTIGAYAGGFNMLIVGSDEDAETRDTVLNDVNILVHVSEDQTNAVAVSIPRDLVVPFPSCTREDGTQTSPMSGRPINEALYYGGLACAVTVTEELTGLDIQFAGMTTFSGVSNMASAVGGVPVCLATDMRDRYTGVNLSAGTHTLEGDQAMLFLRSRHGVGDGSDLTRISSQQVFMSSLLRKLKSEDTLTSPSKLISLANVAKNNMTLSKELVSVDTMAAMALALNNVGLENMTFVQYPGATGGTGIYANKVQPVQYLADELFAKIQADEPFKLEQAGDGRGSIVDPNATQEASEPTEPAEPTEPTEAASEDAGTDGTEADPAPSNTPEVLAGQRGQTAADQTCTVAN